MKILGMMLMAAAVLPLGVLGDAQYYRALDGQEAYYTRGNAIFRRSDGQQLYYLRDKRIYRFSDNTPLYTITEDTISHVDGHGHNHRLPHAIKALAELKDELGIRIVRRCQDLAVPGGRLGLLSRAINGPMQRRLAAAGFHMTDHFLMNAGHIGDRDWFSKALHALPDGVTEIGIHPGSDDHWRRVDTEDCFANCRRLCEELQIPRTSYSELSICGCAFA